MQINKKKNTSLILLESKEEIESFTTICEHYMDMVFEDEEDYPADKLMKQLADKFIEE